MAGKTPSETRLPQGAEIGRSAAKASKSAFIALLCRDLAVLKKNLKEFIPRTIIQPFLLVFVFLYVFPKIGQGIGGGGPPGGAAFATRLVARPGRGPLPLPRGQAVRPPLGPTIGYTHESEERGVFPPPLR